MSITHKHWFASLSLLYKITHRLLRLLVVVELAEAQSSTRTPRLSLWRNGVTTVGCLVKSAKAEFVNLYLYFQNTTKSHSFYNIEV